jgi:DNA invertase Pin-like site-specific DNA recombinase
MTMQDSTSLPLVSATAPVTSPGIPPAMPAVPGRPPDTFRDPKVRAYHLAKRAFIYVRQSSPTQVQRHPESARRQYGLTERAKQLGWSVEQITVIDDDQGKSAAGSAAAHERGGFGSLVSAVGLGEVGIVLALEVARLARNSAEWYRLLELAALAGTLIADEDAIYDPRLFNDRLLLGLRGTISEVELHCIQARLQGARVSKARRGELPFRLPIGFVSGREGRVELDPDQEVQGAIHTILDQFERLGSVSRVLGFFREHGLKVPRRRWRMGEPDELVWVKPSYQAIHQIVVNPIYAGAYAYGQRRQDPDGPVGLGLGSGQLGQRRPRRRFALDQVEILIRDHHPAYVTWERYLANRQTLRDNCQRFQSSRGAPREGQALLAGIVYCGRCGCRMRPRYSESSPSYACISRRQLYGEPICQSLTIEHVDRAVSEAFLTVIQPAQLEAALALAEEFERDRALVERQWELRLERARYEAERAQRQYDRVEPENRLVARELESRWNDKLRAVADLETEYRRENERGLSPLTEEEKGLLRGLVGDVPALWHSAETTAAERKRLLRCLIGEVILLRDEGARGARGVTTIRIGWRSGAWSELQVRRPSAGDQHRTSEQVLARIRTLAVDHSDDRIAAVLNAEGLQTRQGLPWNYHRVKQIRGYHDIPTACPIMPSDLANGSAARGDGLVPLAAAASRLDVTRGALLHWWRWGFIQGEQKGRTDPLWVRLDEVELARLDGTLAAQGHGRWRIREAQRELGLSKEGIWQRARAGELTAYRARVDAHWEWRLSPSGDRDHEPPLPQCPLEPAVAQDN